MRITLGAIELITIRSVHNKMKLKGFILLLFIANSTFNCFSQASWSTEFAFILRDENNEVLNLNHFKESYKLINVYGDTVSNKNLINYLRFDEKTNYFIVDITTIGPIFSFALAHNNQIMAIYLPFNHEDNYYAIDFKFRKGEFLLDFDITNREKIYFNSNMPHFIIEKINWNKQAKKFKKSSYSDYNSTYNLKTNEKD
jgi:hypothetical protein